MGASSPVAGQGQCPSLLDVRLWRASVNGTTLRGKIVMVGDLFFLSTTPSYRSPTSHGSIPSAFFCLPGNLFQPEVTLCCPGTPLPAESPAPTKLRTRVPCPSPPRCRHHLVSAAGRSFVQSARRLSLPFPVPRAEPPRPPRVSRGTRSRQHRGAAGLCPVRGAAGTRAAGQRAMFPVA